MKQTGLLLLILSLTVQLVQAQHSLILANRKLSPVLQNNRKLFANKEEQVFWIVTSNIDSAKNYFNTKKLPIRILRELAGGLLVVSAKGGTVDSMVLPLSFVRFVDIPRQPHEELAVTPFDNSLNTINLVHSRFPQLNGNNFVVSIKENKPDTTDIDFRGRYISSPLSSASVTSHASYMGTIIAGGENSFFTSVGVAPAASFISSSFNSLLPDADADYKKYGVTVQNHSYGTGIENYYGADAAAYDASIINNPGLLHVFSSGNSGNLNSTGPYAGIANMANITGSFKMAKNIITVGATDSFGSVSFLSSRGPAYDGRIKPELVAFGEDGSSGAAAHTSGAVLLLQQYYKEKKGSLPPASLVKAVLVNSADDKGAKGPDYLSGFGSLNTYKAVQAMVNEQYYAGLVAQGGQQTFSLSVPANTRQLKLTICWTDPPATVNAARALVNDLDVELVNNGNGQVWQPWVLSPAPIIDSLLLPAVRKKDTLNNVEQITLDNPAGGTYTIRVKGFSVPAGSQAFFIAWQTAAADQFQWQFPVSVDQVKGGEENLVRWSSTFNPTAGLLEYSVNKGLSWQKINNAAAVAAGYAYWPAPDTCSTALLRMTINGQVFMSDTFTISSPISVKVGFNCPDSAMLFWDPVRGINQYAVYRLGDKYLQPLLTTTDTSVIIRQPGNDLWYTVAPVISPTRQGMKAYTINFQMQGVDCYLKNFLVDLQNGNTGFLTAEIGTTYNVKSITFEKHINRIYQPLKTFQPVTELTFSLVDNNLADGVNTYRVKIELTNGKIIYSDPQSIYYFLTTRYIVFPNPVKKTGALSVLTKEEPVNTYLLLFNAVGQQVLQYRLTQTVETISLPGLQGGIYFILIKKNGKKEFTGKVIVQ